LRPLVALAFHAERLHETTTWAHVATVVRRIAHGRASATLFVYPFPAHVAGGDLTDRLQALTALGQEIGQHTHFYAGHQIGKTEKTDDFSDDNVKRCIQRDFRLLEQAGARCRGFVAGAWIVTPTVLDTLAELGFSYDCSARLPRRERYDRDRLHEWLTTPRVETRQARALIRLPTTCSLGEWFKWGWRLRAAAPEPFQIVYLHDYDLNRPRMRWLLAAFVRLNRGRMIPAGALPARLATGANVAPA
jgi:hypothetical protein